MKFLKVFIISLFFTFVFSSVYAFDFNISLGKGISINENLNFAKLFKDYPIGAVESKKSYDNSKVSFFISDKFLFSEVLFATVSSRYLLYFNDNSVKTYDFEGKFIGTSIGLNLKHKSGFITYVSRTGGTLLYKVNEELRVSGGSSVNTDIFTTYSTYFSLFFAFYIKDRVGFYVEWFEPLMSNMRFYDAGISTLFYGCSLSF